MIDIARKHTDEISVPNPALRKLLFICTKNNRFQFNSQLYRHIDGFGMGSPLRALLANMFVVHLENSRLASSAHVVSLYKCHTDDTLVVFSCKQQIQTFLGELNETYPNI